MGALERAIGKQNQVLSSFIANVQNELRRGCAGAGPGAGPGAVVTLWKEVFSQNQNVAV